MFGLTRTKNTDRAAEIRAALESTEAGLAAARERLGVAIADGEDGAARAARDEIARLSSRVAELAAALPVTERRAREAAQREEAQRIRELNKAANAQRAKRLQAARAVDKALSALGRAFDTYAATEPGATTENRFLLARRAGAALRAATLHSAANFADAVAIPRVAVAYRRSLAEQESAILAELDEQ